MTANFWRYFFRSNVSIFSMQWWLAVFFSSVYFTFVHLSISVEKKSVDYWYILLDFQFPLPFPCRWTPVTVVPKRRTNHNVHYLDVTKSDILIIYSIKKFFDYFDKCTQNQTIIMCTYVILRSTILEMQIFPLNTCHENNDVPAITFSDSLDNL